MIKFRHTYLSLLPLLVMLVLVGCKPEELTPPTPPATFKYKGIHDFFAKNQPKQQVFYLDAAAGGTVTGENGTKVTFAANSFVYKPLNIPVTGLVKIVLQEVTSNSQMALANLSTISGQDPLVSGGMTHVRVFSENNGLEVKLATGMMYSTEYPAIGTPSNNMQTFIEQGNDNNAAVTWVNNPNASAVVVPTGNSYIMTNDSLHWQSCNAFMTALGFTSPTKVTVEVPGSPILLDSCVCFVNYKGQKSRWLLNLTANNTFYSDHLFAITADVVVMGCNGQKLYGGIKRDVILTDNLKVSVPLYQMYENQVISMLQTLD